MTHSPAGNPASTGPGALRVLFTLTLTFMGALVMLGIVAVLIAPAVVLPPVWVSLGLLVLVVATVGMSEVLLRGVGPLLPDATGAEAFAAVQPVHITRMALLEAPAIVALVVMFVLPEQSFVTYLIGAVPALIAMTILVVPHRMTLERYEQALDRRGARSGLVAYLTGEPR